jgi:hypothetical protein
MNADEWQLDENDNLVRTNETNDDFNVFIDSEGNEIFRTNEMMTVSEGENINEKIDKVNKVMSEISTADGVFEKMEERAEETGFDNSIFEGGISELKDVADEQVTKQAVIAASDLAIGQIIPTNTGDVVGTYQIISKIYKGVTGGRNVNTDAVSVVKGTGDMIVGGASNVKEETYNFLDRMTQALDAYWDYNTK